MIFRTQLTFFDLVRKNRNHHWFLPKRFKNRLISKLHSKKQKNKKKTKTKTKQGQNQSKEFI